MDLDKLINTPDDMLLTEFKGHTRSFLRNEKKKEIAMRKKNGTIDKLVFDKKSSKLNEEKKLLEKELKLQISINEKLQKEQAAILSLKKKPAYHEILPSKEVDSEATAVLVASDWHSEEEVKGSTVNNMNEFNLEICKYRSEKFFQNSLRLLKMTSKDVEIKNVILALLGDFITGNIHEENVETALLQPIDAVWFAYERITNGIDFLLKNSDYNFTVICKNGNHSRITRKQRHATDSGNSLEGFMYKVLAQRYEKESRIQFVIEDGYLTYFKVYDMMLRFHHGHSIRYSGGSGGITIPARKAIAQWNKIKRADLDVFGHWHQKFDGEDFIINGSLIGWNSYAISIKADFQKPQQTFFLIDKNRGKTIVAPILLNGH